MAARSTAASTLVLPKPGGVLQGDVLLATIHGSGGSGVTITAPAGWTRQTSASTSTVSKTATYTKVAGPAEPASYSFAFSTSAEHTGTIAAYAGVDAAKPVQSSATQANAAAESIRCPSLTTSTPDTVLICTGGATNGFTYTFPAGMAERAEVRSGSTEADRSVAVGDERRATAGATGTRTIADSSSLGADSSVGASIVLAAAGAAVTDTTPPAAPTGLTATAGAGQVRLDWADNAEGDLAGYDVYRSTTNGGPYTKVTAAPVGISTYTDTGLAAGIAHHYVVRALDRSGNESASSGQASATPSAAPAPAVGTLYFRGDAETGDLTQWGSAEHCPTLNTISTQTGVVRKGANGYRMIVRGQCSNMSTGRTRAELRSGSAKYTWSLGDTRYYGWSTYFGTDFPNITNSAHCNFIQWKDGDGGPPLSMSCRLNQIHLDYTPGGTCGWASPLVRGGWHDFVVRVYHHTDAARGRVSLWHKAPGESELKLKVFDCPEATHGTGTHALKQGTYRGDSFPATSTVFQDEMRVGSTFDVVKP